MYSSYTFSLIFRHLPRPLWFLELFSFQSGSRHAHRAMFSQFQEQLQMVDLPPRVKLLWLRCINCQNKMDNEMKVMLGIPCDVLNAQPVVERLRHRQWDQNLRASHSKLNKGHPAGQSLLTPSRWSWHLPHRELLGSSGLSFGLCRTHFNAAKHVP